MPALLRATASSASHRNPGSLADQSLAKIVELLLPAGYGFTIPGWDGDAYLKIDNALRAITDLTITNPDQPYRGTLDITDDGELSWYARAPHHPDGGIPLPDIAHTINRAQHPATHA
jgi:hypothetical protein